MKHYRRPHTQAIQQSESHCADPDEKQECASIGPDPEAEIGDGRIPATDQPGNGPRQAANGQEETDPARCEIQYVVCKDRHHGAEPEIHATQNTQQYNRTRTPWAQTEHPGWKEPNGSTDGQNEAGYGD